MRVGLPLPKYGLSLRLGERYAKGRVAIEDGDADLDLPDLTVEVRRRQRLAEQLYTMPLGFDTASAVVSAPPSPESGTDMAVTLTNPIFGHLGIL